MRGQGRAATWPKRLSGTWRRMAAGPSPNLLLLNGSGGQVLLDRVSSEASGAGEIAGIERLCARAGIAPGDIALFVHGFTLGTNAFPTWRVARALLLVTQGLRDLLPIGDRMRPDPYDLRVVKPEPDLLRYVKSPQLPAPSRSTFCSVIKRLPLGADVMQTVPRQQGSVAAACAGLQPGHVPARHRTSRGRLADRSPTGLQLKPIKIAARVVRHARAFQLAEVAVTGPMVRALLDAIRRLRAPPASA